MIDNHEVRLDRLYCRPNSRVQISRGDRTVVVNADLYQKWSGTLGTGRTLLLGESHERSVTNLEAETPKVKVTRPINAETENAPYSEREGLRTSNLVNGWSTMARVTDMCSDLNDQGYNITSSVLPITRQRKVAELSAKW